jgi:hypothetical protein
MILKKWRLILMWAGICNYRQTDALHECYAFRCCNLFGRI